VKRKCRINYWHFVVAGFMACCSLPASSQNTSFQYFYDDLGQLTKVIDSAGNEIDYIYDAVGNLTQVKRGTAPPGTTLALFNFTPIQGAAGTPVTIYGQAFSTTLTGNTVNFNGTTTPVVKATANTITVTVPSGATTGPITVTVGSNIVTSSLPFTIAAVPIINSLSRKSALFNTVVKSLVVTGSNLSNASFSFQTPAIGVSPPSASTSSSATIDLRTGAIPGTFGLVASAPLGNSSMTITKSNRFTVVDPSSTADSDGDGWPDFLEALAGTDPLDPTSFPSGEQFPAPGEADSVVLSVLNSPYIQTAIIGEANAVVFSVLNASVLAVPNFGEADAVVFSLSNTAKQTAAQIQPQKPLDSDGDGYPDDLERALGSDPNDPTSIPNLQLPPETDSTVFSVLNDAQPTASTAVPPRPSFSTVTSLSTVGRKP
jgi:YD repeat-containing protein